MAPSAAGLLSGCCIWGVRERGERGREAAAARLRGRRRWLSVAVVVRHRVAQLLFGEVMPEVPRRLGATLGEGVLRRAEAEVDLILGGLLPRRPGRLLALAATGRLLAKALERRGPAAAPPRALVQGAARAAAPRAAVAVLPRGVPDEVAARVLRVAVLLRVHAVFVLEILELEAVLAPALVERLHLDDAFPD